MDILFAPETRPFGIAGLVLVGLVVLELASVMAGLSASHLIDKGIGHHDGDDAGGFLSGALAWLNPGRVPILILLMLALGGFSALGYLIDAVAMAIWQPLPPTIAAVVAFLGTMPFMRRGSHLVSRIVPRDESYAVGNEEFVGFVATVTIGPLDDGKPGRVRLKDRFGNWHFLIARAAEGQAPLAVGSSVLLVDKRDQLFLAVAAEDPLLAGNGGQT